MIEVGLVLTGFVLFFMGVFAGANIPGLDRSPKQLPPSKDPLEERIYPYLTLLDNDPAGWQVSGRKSWNGWMKLEHHSGKSISIYKADNDVYTDVFSETALNPEEKELLRKAVFKLESLRTIDSLVYQNDIVRD